MKSKNEIFYALEKAEIISKEERKLIESILDNKNYLLTENEKKQREKSNEIIVSKILREIGISYNLLGYSYIKASILIALDEPSLLKKITKGLYPRVAKEFETTPNRVERAIRNAVEVAWIRGNVETLHNIFGYTINSEKGKSTNSEFIAGVVEYIKVNLL